MSGSNGTHGGKSGKSDASDTGNATIAAKERDVVRNREQLASTVDALQAKLDVKSRAKARARLAQDRATTADGKPRPEIIGVASAVLVGVVALIWWRRR